MCVCVYWLVQAGNLTRLDSALTNYIALYFILFVIHCVALRGTVGLSIVENGRGLALVAAMRSHDRLRVCARLQPLLEDFLFLDSPDTK